MPTTTVRFDFAQRTVVVGKAETFTLSEAETFTLSEAETFTLSEAETKPNTIVENMIEMCHFGASATTVPFDFAQCTVVADAPKSTLWATVAPIIPP